MFSTGENVNDNIATARGERQKKIKTNVAIIDSYARWMAQVARNQ